MKNSTSKHLLLGLIFLFSIFNGITSAQDPKTLKVMTYNVLLGFNGSDSYKQKFKTWIAKDLPDIIGFQEMSNYTEETFAAFAKSYGHEYSILLATGNCCPIALSSKYPISNVKKLTSDLKRGTLIAEILDYQVVVLHLNPFEWEKRLQEIHTIMQNIKPNTEDKVIVMGDFNSMSPVDKAMYDTKERLDALVKSKSKNANNGAYDYSVIGKMQNSGFVDSYWEANMKYGFTCPTRLHSAVGNKNNFRIDYIWLSDILRDRIKSCDVIYDSTTHLLSDHYPVLLTLER